MDSRRYLAALRHWWWLPLVGVLSTVVISYLVGRELPPVYEARATLLVNFASPRVAPTYNDALLSQQLVKTYAQMLVQPIVLEQVGPRLGLDLSVDELERVVRAQAIRDTQLLTVSAQALQPELAQDIANTTADIFIAQQDQRLSLNTTTSAISVIQPAHLAVQPVEPKLAIEVGFAAILGLLMTLGLVYLLAWIDDTIKTASEAERATSAPMLGIIPDILPNSPSGRIWVHDAYRLLRTALDFASARQPVRAILVTSPGPGEGKSTVVVNLATTIAEAGARVIAVDADLRKPNLHRQFGLSNEYGLTTLLEHGAEPNAELTVHCRVVRPANLRVLTAGPSSLAATELLRSPRFAHLLEQLRIESDVVVLDSAPALGAADALVIARQVDATLLVLAATATRPAAARRASLALSRSGTRLLGFVLNRAHVERDASYAAPQQAAPQAAKSC